MRFVTDDLVWCQTPSFGRSSGQRPRLRLLHHMLLQLLLTRHLPPRLQNRRPKPSRNDELADGAQAPAAALNWAGGTARSVAAIGFRPVGHLPSPDGPQALSYASSGAVREAVYGYDRGHLPCLSSLVAALAI